jgi:hypothetical protein
LKEAIMENNKPKIYLFLAFHIVGALLGLTLTLLATWADLESVYYAYDFRASAQFSGMNCPILMSANETNSFSAKITNTTDKKLSPSIKTEISSRLLPVSSLEFVELEPGESKTLEWTIGPENIDLKYFIFAKVLVYASYPIPNREATCGVFIVDLPTNGTVITWAMVVLSLLGMGSGLYGLNRFQGRTQSGADVPRPIVFLSIVVIAGLITSFMGWWMPGVLIIAVTLLFIGIALGIIINRG